jgi:peptidylprolyl isomerase
LNLPNRLIVPAVLLVALAAGCKKTEKSLSPTQTAPTVASSASSAAGINLPSTVPPVTSAIETAFALRYQDIKIGTGAEAEPSKIYKVHYTGWLASDGRKFDSSYDHRAPVMGPDGKPEMEEDGKPKLGDSQPISIPQGFGRVIPGFDQGFNGMRIGGKRRLFIPWQLAYGARGRPGPDPAHPGIPPMADLIFDIELVDVSDLQLPTNHPGMGGMPGGAPMRMPNPGALPTTPATPAAPATPTAPGTPATPPPAATPATSGTPATPPADKPQSN